MKKLALLALLLAGCAAPSPSEGDPQGPPTRAFGYIDGRTEVTRMIDEELNIVCYVSDGYKAGGISCLYRPRTLREQLE